MVIYYITNFERKHF